MQRESHPGLSAFWVSVLSSIVVHVHYHLGLVGLPPLWLSCHDQDGKSCFTAGFICLRVCFFFSLSSLSFKAALFSPSTLPRERGSERGIVKDPLKERWELKWAAAEMWRKEDEASQSACEDTGQKGQRIGAKWERKDERWGEIERARVREKADRDAQMNK